MPIYEVYFNNQFSKFDFIKFKVTLAFLRLTAMTRSVHFTAAPAAERAF